MNNTEKIVKYVGTSTKELESLFLAKNLSSSSSIRQARLVFLANDAGSNVTKKTTDKCNYYNIEVSTVFNALELRHGYW